VVGGEKTREQKKPERAADLRNAGGARVGEAGAICFFGGCIVGKISRGCKSIGSKFANYRGAQNRRYISIV
jgi:hypothetical protein